MTLNLVPRPNKFAEEPVMVVRRGERKRLRERAEVILEDGGVLWAETALPLDLPLGYHTLRYLDSDCGIRLIVSPRCCYLPKVLRVWGWSAQLYAFRSLQSWGMGDFNDLWRLARWSAKEFRARLLLVNPLQAASPIVPQEPSPYFPSSRRFRNLLYLHIEDVPGAARTKIGS